MATTDFLQWNPTGSNMESDATYLADSQRLAGATDGEQLASILGNKLFYQLSTLCAAIGQFGVNQGVSTSDGGGASNSVTNLATALEAFIATLHSPQFTGTVTIGSTAIEL